MKYFGTDGIRNNSLFFLKDNFSYNIGRALSLLYNKNIYIGYDTRKSSQTICNLVISGALSKGLIIYNLGMTSTPSIAYYSLLNDSIGISITASHNIYSDNGIKIFIDGIKINNKEIELIENYLQKPDSDISFGSLFNKCPLEYINFLNQFKTDTSNVILDTSNGATSNLSKYFFKNIINNSPDGTNINLNCGSTNLTSLLNETVNKYDYGIAFDGDGDRIQIIDHFGNIYTGDMLLYFLSKYYNEKHVVLTKMVNLGIYNLFINNNININLVDVGDSNVYKELKEKNLYLGGEDSGHIINMHLLPFGDGLLNALFILKILNDKKINLIDIINPNIKYQELLINFIEPSISLTNKINNLLIEYKNNPNVKILYRKSGTENLYRLYISTKDIEDLNRIKKELDNE